MIRHAHENQPGRGGCPEDQLGQAKDRLGHVEAELGIEVVRRYPKTALLAAFAAGIAFASIPIARRFIWGAGLWTAKRAASNVFKRK